MESKGIFSVAIFTTVLCFSGHVLAALSGSGTEASPYLIQSRADFDEFANPANAALYWASGIHTKLMCDPNLADTTYTQAVIAPDTNSSNSSFQGTQFTGVFDGNGHTISNLMITESGKDFFGLFGYIGTNGQVKNLGVLNANVNGRNYVGGLTGNNSGTISSCYATGAVSGKDRVGGLAGLIVYGTITSCYATGMVGGSYYVGGLAGWNNSGTISSCYATGAVTGTYSVGGLMGYNVSGTISSCYATGTVSGTSYVGGLAGYHVSGTISSCYATGAVSGGTYDVGGLAGNNRGTISSCYATGVVSGYSDVGGLVGYNDYGTITSCCATGAVNGEAVVGGLVGGNGSGTISSCYATGDVSGTSHVGGLAGDIVYGTITSCYSAGTVSGTGTSSQYVGGLVGRNYLGKIIRCYSTGRPTGVSNVGGLCGYKTTGTGYEDTGNFWDTESSEITTSTMGTGKTTVQMITLSTFTDAGWDFSLTDGDAADWMMLRENEDYPRLAWQTIFPGDIAGLYGVDMEDLNMLIEYWLGTWHVKADIVDDSIVNMIDLSVIGQNWMLTECGDCNGADITGDGTVDIQDTAVLADQWLFQENPGCQLADIDNSGTVDLADLSILAANWMKQ